VDRCPTALGRLDRIEQVLSPQIGMANSVPVFVDFGITAKLLNYLIFLWSTADERAASLFY
jgi:hypothetical protein